MAYKMKCGMCGADFGTAQPHAKFCSTECRKKMENIRWGRHVHGERIPPASVGAMSELFVAADLLRRGYAVFRALSPSCFCDLIAIKDERTLLFEVRTGYKSLDGKITYPTKLRGNAGAFAIYERNGGEIFYLDLSGVDLIL